MRDYRDAKSMAHMLRETLAAKDYKISVGESLELIAHLFGVADWNTLSAMIKNSGSEPHPSLTRPESPPFFAPSLEETLHRALQAAVERWQSEATLEHVLLSLTEDPDAMAIMSASGVDPAAARDRLARSADAATPRHPGNMTEARPTGTFQRVVQRAILEAQASGERPITGAHLLVAILSERDSTAVRKLGLEGLDLASARKLVRRRKG